MQRPHAGLEGLRSGEDLVVAEPGTAVTAAADLVLSLRLLLDAGAPGAEPDLERALTARFSAEQLRRAFAHLRTRGHVYHSLARRPFHLSDVFKEGLQARF